MMMGEETVRRHVPPDQWDLWRSFFAVKPYREPPGFPVVGCGWMLIAQIACGCIAYVPVPSARVEPDYYLVVRPCDPT
jgi:hypothetical protein